jgi:hypothetical protein
MTSSTRDALTTEMNDSAEAYVKLVLSVGEHDSDYVDAYFGPPAWREEVKSAAASLDSLHSSAEQLLRDLENIQTAREEEIVQLRHRYLTRQLRSLLARLEMLGGRRFSFDEEAQALYDTNPPHYPEIFFREALSRLDGMIPGTGTITDRYDRWMMSSRQRFANAGSDRGA